MPFQEWVKTSNVRPLKKQNKYYEEVQRDCDFQAIRKNAIKSIVLDTDINYINTKPDEFLLWYKDISYKQTLKTVARNIIGFTDTIDLHNHSIESARNKLSKFIKQSVIQKHRCIKITHGKSREDRPFTLKGYVNSMLQCNEFVHGFVSSLPKHGGTGAVYVLLKDKHEK